MPRALVLDLCLIIHRPVWKRLMVMMLARRSGMDVICRSYLGRSTTKKLLRKLNVLHEFDDFLWNDKPTPEGSLEIFDPADSVFQLGPDVFARL